MSGYRAWLGRLERIAERAKRHTLEGDGPPERWGPSYRHDTIRGRRALMLHMELVRQKRAHYEASRWR
ncbi:MAG: hypothetical protein RL885_25180 [Planctomycetota bacterium]